MAGNIKGIIKIIKQKIKKIYENLIKFNFLNHK